MSAVERIGDGYESFRHALEVAPAEIDDVVERLQRIEDRVEAGFGRIEAVLDALESFSEGPMGRMMMRKLSKGTDAD